MEMQGCHCQNARLVSSLIIPRAILFNSFSFCRYGIPSILSIPEKVQLSTEILRPSSDQILSITYFSAASFPFAAPPVVAQGVGWPSFGLGIEGVNSRVGRWLLDRLAEDERLSGWALMDYFSTPGKTLGPLLAEFNFVQRPKA